MKEDKADIQRAHILLRELCSSNKDITTEDWCSACLAHVFELAWEDGVSNEVVVGQIARAVAYYSLLWEEKGEAL
jgi:hypothetical protein